MSHRGIDPLQEGEHDPGPMRRTLTRAGLTAVAVGVLVGVFVLASWLVRDTRTDTTEVSLEDLPQLALSAPTADVTVETGDVDAVVVEARVTRGLLDTDYALRRRDAQLEVVGSCVGWLNPGCGVDVTVTVPADLPLVLTGGSGDVSVEGLGGVLGLVTTSGDVTARGLVADDLSVETVAGDVDVVFAEDSRAVKVATASGDVDVRLPGAEPYLLDAASRDGDVTTSLEGDDDVDRFVRVRTESGDVEVGRTS